MRRSILFLLVVALFVTGVLPAGAAVTPVGGTFEDDDGNIHEGFIEAIAALGITLGCNPAGDAYCPTQAVRRGQMAAFLNRALTLPPASMDYFTDDAGSIFEDDINRIAEAGITFGCNPPGNDQYCPNDSVSRGQMAAFIARAFGFTDPGPGDWFVDDDGSVFEEDIDRIANAGVTVGCNPAGDAYCPTLPVRRDQMATFLGRAMMLTPLVPPSPQDFLLEPDGIGSLTFGLDTDFVLTELAVLGDPGVMGAPEDDTGWINSFSVFGTCPGTEIRVVRWGNLEVFFKRFAITEDGEFFTYRVSDFFDDRTDLKLRTAEGLRLDDTVATLQALYGSRVTIELIDPFMIWEFRIDDTGPGWMGLGGTLTGDAPADPVQFIDAGERCGE